MSEQLTNEFSICLLPDAVVSRQLGQIRARLPDSPYERDDTPHLTLHRGITAPGAPRDTQLIHDVTELIDLPHRLPIEAPVEAIYNGSSKLYSSTGVLLLKRTNELVALRSRAAALLLHRGYSIEEDEQDASRWIPHITVRLGVSLEDEMLAKAEELFPSGRTIQFSSWLLLRLIMNDGKRMMRELMPISS